MKEKRLTPAESFSLGNGPRGALIARTGSLIASGGNAVCCWTVGCCGCCAGCVCGFCPVCPDASANIQSSADADARKGLNILFSYRLNGILVVRCLAAHGHKIIREPFPVVVLILCSNFRRWLSGFQDVFT